MSANMADLPSWVDKALSADLPRLRSAGEGQALEYMEQFPENVHELGKEIAAFATSNPGVIIIGVADDGSVVGLPGAEAMSARDKWTQRVEGICNGTVKPPVKA